MHYDKDILEAVQILKVLDEQQTMEEKVRTLIDILEEIKQEYKDLWYDYVRA